MPYICNYKFCEHDKLIGKGQAIGCSKCEKPFHKDCFEKHNKDKHNGKAVGRPLREIELPKSQIIRR